MARHLRLAMTVGLVISGLMPAVWAVEQGQPSDAKPAATSPSPVQATATSTPSSSIVEGTIASLDLASATPSLKVTGADGKSWTLGVDPKTSSIWKNGQMVKWEDLKQGQSVKIRHAMIGGKDLAQSVRIVSASKPVASTTAAASTSKSQAY